MNGLITFVLVVLVQVSVLAQASVIAQVLGQGAEVLPDSKNGPVLPNSPPGLPGISGIPGISGPRPTSQTSVGWGNDPEGIFCIIVQIPPEKIAGFAQGETGNELFANIPPDIQPYVQRVIVRVGTGPVEKRLQQRHRAVENRSHRPIRP